MPFVETISMKQQRDFGLPAPNSPGLTTGGASSRSQRLLGVQLKLSTLPQSDDFGEGVCMAS